MNLTSQTFVHGVFGDRANREVTPCAASACPKRCALPGMDFSLWDPGHLETLAYTKPGCPPTSPRTCRAVLPAVAFLADADPILADPAAAAGVGAVQPGAILTSESLLAHAGAVHAAAAPRAVSGAAQLRAVIPGESLLAHALAVHAEPPGAAAGGAAELGAVLAAVVAVADALALQAHAAAGAAPWAERLRAVAARPALHAHAAARLQAEIPVAAALRDVIQLPCKDAGPRVRTHRVGGGKRSVLVSGQPSEGLEKGVRCGARRGSPSL